MNRYLSIVLLILCFVVFTIVNNLMFGSARLDLTENRLYSVSEGTK